MKFLKYQLSCEVSVNVCSTHLLAPDVYNTGTFINLRLPLTAVSDGGVVFVPGPGCYLWPEMS